MTTPPRVVIVGCGFGGLWAVRNLAAAPAHVVVVDRNNYHTFFPLLYQVAAAEQTSHDICFPVREILHNIPNAEFLLAEVRRIDYQNRRLHTDRVALDYDFLVLTTGSSTNFYAIPGAADHAFPLRTLDQAVVLRNHILTAFERAVIERDPQLRRRFLNFVIVGGGPTGVEFAGSLAELVHGPIRKDYPRLDLREVRIVLLEMGATVLAGFPAKLTAYAARRLTKLGVELRLGDAVSAVAPDAVKLKSGEEIPTETAIWTAGVIGDIYDGTGDLEIARRGQLKVLPSLQSPRHPNVYLIGDLAYWEQDGKPIPQIAPVAIQQGARVAHNIRLQLAGKDPQPFRYRDKGQLAVIGRAAAVARLRTGLTFTGFTAWVLWLVVHIFYLVGFRNRFFVIANWALDYFFYQRKVRLIIGGSSSAGAPASPPDADPNSLSRSR